MFKQIKRRKQEKEFQKELNLALGLKMEKFAEAQFYHIEGHAELKHMDNNWKYAPQTQKGFAAETKTVSRTNAVNAISGNPHRIVKTDNIKGSVNHPKYDTVAVDSAGKPIRTPSGDYTGGGQEKFHDDIATYDLYYGKLRYDKYKGAKIDVPKDKIVEIKQRYDDKIANLKQQEQHLRSQGKNDIANEKRETIKRIEDVKSRLRDSKVTMSEALEARKNPNLSTIKDMGMVSHKAGMQAAKGGAAIGGAISTVSNAKAVVDGDKDIGEALLSIANDSGKTASKSYVHAATSSALGGALKASNNHVVKSLSKKNVPAAIVSTAGILAKQTTKLISGKITSEEFVQNIGQEGFSLASSITGSNLGAIVGTAIVPGLGTVVGGFIGGMVSSMLSGATYNELIKTINDTKLSDEKRIFISDYCQKLKEEERRYREEMTEILNQFYEGKETQIIAGFELISESLASGGDINVGLSEVAKAFNIELAFSSTDDFSQRIKSGKTLEL